jgi:hypothetical protein
MKVHQVVGQEIEHLEVRVREFGQVLRADDHLVHRGDRPAALANGKVERFNRTLAAEWAYADTYLSDEARSSTYQAWLHDYNHHRPHTGSAVTHPSNASAYITSPGITPR